MVRTVKGNLSLMHLSKVFLHRPPLPWSWLERSCLRLAGPVARLGKGLPLYTWEDRNIRKVILRNPIPMVILCSWLGIIVSMAGKCSTGTEPGCPGRSCGSSADHRRLTPALVLGLFPRCFIFMGLLTIIKEKLELWREARSGPDTWILLWNLV